MARNHRVVEKPLVDWVFQESTIPESYTTGFIKGFGPLPYSSKVRFLCGNQETGWPEISITTLVAAIVVGTPGIDSQFLVGAQKSVDKLVRFRGQRIQHVLRSFLGHFTDIPAH